MLREHHTSSDVDMLHRMDEIHQFDESHRHAYTALLVQAFQTNGYLSATLLQNLKMSFGPGVVDRMLLYFQNNDLLHIISSNAEETIYDVLPVLEKAVAEHAPDVAMQFQLATIHCYRKMWTHAIAELRLIKAHPDFRKESLYLLGQCFEYKGAVQKAREQYECLLALDYGYRDTRTRLENLQVPPQYAAIPGTSARSTLLFHPKLPPALQERYEIIRELGRGGAGMVYQAIDLKLRRDVALKLLYERSGQSHGDVAEILHEARLAAQLDHPNLIDVYDVNTEARCIIMEFASGGTLQTLLKTRGSLSIDQARSVIIQLCQGLQVAHAAGVLHRDIKPANIFITQHRTFKLGDFGIAHITAADPDELLRLIGTLPYMSPEQVRGEPLTAASDIYTLGIVFYEMLTGAPPFMRGDIAYHHCYSSPVSPGIAETLDAIVLRCLAKVPAERFQSVEELRRVLQQDARDEKTRLDKYRELLKIALLDKDLSDQERLILKLKRKSFGISVQEARRVEKEIGLDLPSKTCPESPEKKEDEKMRQF